MTRFPGRHDYDAMHALTLGIHEAALGEAKIIWDRDHDAPGVTVSRGVDRHRFEVRDRDILGRYRHVNQFALLTREPVFPRLRGREAIRQAEEVARIGLARVFHRHLYQDAVVDHESLGWAERLMLDAIRHFERVGRVRR